MLKIHETINSIGVLLSILLAGGSFYVSWINLTAKQENIRFSSELDSSNFESRITKMDGYDGFYVSLRYILLMSNLSERATSVINIRYTTIMKHKSGTYFDDFASLPGKVKPIHLKSGQSKIVYKEVRIPIENTCYFEELRRMNGRGKIRKIREIFSEHNRIFPNCLPHRYDDGSYEPLYYITPGYSINIKPKNKTGGNEFGSAYYEPIKNMVFQITTARGSKFVAYSSTYDIYDYTKRQVPDLDTSSAR